MYSLTTHDPERDTFLLRDGDRPVTFVRGREDAEEAVRYLNALPAEDAAALVSRTVTPNVAPDCGWTCDGCRACLN